MCRRPRDRQASGRRRLTGERLISESRTPNTLSADSSSPATKMWVIRVRWPAADTMKCRWGARIGDRAVAASSTPDRAVIRDRVRRRGERPEPVAAVVLGEQVRAGGEPVVRRTGRRRSRRRRPPTPRAGPRQRRAVLVAHGSLDPARFAGCAEREVAAVVDLRRAVDEERSEDGRFGDRVVGGMIDGDGLHRQAEHVREQDELLAPVVGDVPGRGQELDRGRPLGLGQPDLAGEGVQVSWSAPSITSRRRGSGVCVEAREHGLGQRRLAGGPGSSSSVGHDVSSWIRRSRGRTGPGSVQQSARSRSVDRARVARAGSAGSAARRRRAMSSRAARGRAGRRGAFSLGRRSFQRRVGIRRRRVRRRCVGSASGAAAQFQREHVGQHDGMGGGVRKAERAARGRGRSCGASPIRPRRTRPRPGSSRTGFELARVEVGRPVDEPEQAVRAGR